MTAPRLHRAADSLERRLGLRDAVTVGAGSMIGAGVFSAWGPAADAAGTGLLIGLVVAAVVAFCNATSSAQLAALHPESGGTYVYARRQLGPVVGAPRRLELHRRQDRVVCRARPHRRRLPVARSRPPRRRRGGRRRRRSSTFGGLTRTVAVTKCLLVVALGALAVGRRSPAGPAATASPRAHRSDRHHRPTASCAQPGSCSSPSPATPASPPSARKSATPPPPSPRRSRALWSAYSSSTRPSASRSSPTVPDRHDRHERRPARPRRRRHLPFERLRPDRARRCRHRRPRRPPQPHPRRSLAPCWRWPADTSCLAWLATLDEQRVHTAARRSRRHRRRHRAHRNARPPRSDRLLRRHRSSPTTPSPTPPASPCRRHSVAGPRWIAVTGSRRLPRARGRAPARGDRHRHRHSRPGGDPRAPNTPHPTSDHRVARQGP